MQIAPVDLQDENAADRFAWRQSAVVNHVVAHHQLMHVRQRNPAVADKRSKRGGRLGNLTLETTADVVSENGQLIHADKHVLAAQIKKANHANAARSHVVNTIALD